MAFILFRLCFCGQNDDILNYDLVRSKREYYHNCSLAVVLCSFLYLYNHLSSSQVWSTRFLLHVTGFTLCVLCVLDLFAYVSTVLYYMCMHVVLL